MTTQPSPEQAVRRTMTGPTPTPEEWARISVHALRAKAAELERTVKTWERTPDRPADHYHSHLAADIALVAQLLADHIERST